jgi:ABC-type uncharacterized transport system fused permease/ATPase subunit
VVALVLAAHNIQHGIITAVIVFVFLTTTGMPITIGQELLIQALHRAVVVQFNSQMLAAVHGKASVFKEFG